MTAFAALAVSIGPASAGAHESHRNAGCFYEEMSCCGFTSRKARAKVPRRGVECFTIDMGTSERLRVKSIWNPGDDSDF